MYKKGYHHTEEEKEKIRLSKLGERNPMYHKEFSIETRARMSESQKNREKNPQQWAKMREVRKGFKATNETRKKNSEASKGNHSHLGNHSKFNPEACERLKEVRKKQWQSEEFRNKTVRASRLGSMVRPTKPEQYLIDVLNEHYPNEWKYVGDGELIINGKNPDIMNINGRKSLILMHGIYWHLLSKQKDNPELTKGKVEEADMAFYKAYGYSILIIWDDELKHPAKVLDKIKQFCDAEVVHA
jgi:G:T-mismatch repair DNA endonuclease (very short patch repair protein)